MAYPENCLRGISSSDQIIPEDGSVSTAAFNFSDVVREDGWKELSINWDDNDLARQTLLEQRKENGELQFKIGYVVIPRDEIDHLIRQPTINGALSYERHPIDNNDFHGNILIRGDLPKPSVRKIQAGLALIVSSVFQRKSE